MDKKRIELAITGVLVVIFIFAWGNTIKLWRRRPAVIKVPEAVPGQNVLKPAATAQEGLSPKPKEGLQWVRDPFSGKIYSHQGLGVDLSLSGILWDAKRPQALINDRICNIGDVINGCKVLEIQKNKVILNDGSKQIELKID
ncbi:MAG TPA: hypothetical protein VI976_02705 [Candidatus Omnitrophota bacterium]|nr:hypothetical protein [Candidatus Omnitrophota bacterium]